MTLEMKGRPDRFYLEKAPSGRSACRRCKRAIPKGSARLSALCFVMPGRATKLVRHVGCAGAKEIVTILRAHGSLDAMPCGLKGEAKHAALATLRGIQDDLRAHA